MGSKTRRKQRKLKVRKAAADKAAAAARAGADKAAADKDDGDAWLAFFKTVMHDRPAAFYAKCARFLEEDHDLYEPGDLAHEDQGCKIVPGARGGADVIQRLL